MVRKVTGTKVWTQNPEYNYSIHSQGFKSYSKQSEGLYNKIQCIQTKNILQWQGKAVGRTKAVLNKKLMFINMSTAK